MSMRHDAVVTNIDLIELGSALGDFFESDGTRRVGPSHDELDGAIARAGLAAGDPRRASPVIGKTKRIRQVLVYATDHDPAAGLKLAVTVVSLMRADGMFIPAAESYVGDAKVEALRRAFLGLGFDLSANGAVRPLVIDNLTGTQLTDALRAYVNRINLNPDDAPLQIGTGKELDEAAARQVLEERTGSYATSGRAGSYPVTLAQAFTVLGLAVPGNVDLNDDPHRAVQECLFLLSVAVNRLRNDAGSGHGRPRWRVRGAQ
jgi:hypothetical protein